MKNSNDTKGARASLPVRIFRFYADGFRSMTVGRYLWAMILIKLFILFFVFKLLFFPNLLQRDYDTDAERAGAVRRAMIDRSDRADAPSDQPRNSFP